MEWLTGWQEGKLNAASTGGNDILTFEKQRENGKTQ